MSTAVRFAPLLLAPLFLTACDGAPARVPLGFSPRTAADQARIEERFRSAVSADSISALHLPLTQRPHFAGSAGSAEVIAHLESTLRGFGLDVERFDYQAYLSAPVSERITLTAPVRRELPLDEPAIAEDPTSSHPELGGSWIAYSASGVAEGEVVYVNYGLPADYAELQRMGVSVRGRIALARYGRSHRAVKVFGAQNAGARAIVFYSDPADDGEVRGAPWPDGYWRGSQMAQRGNAKMSWYFHGDALTPGVAATADAPRLDPREAPTVPRIPVMALGWDAARHILSALGGREAPATFRGGVPGVTYRVGPGPARVSLEVRHDDGLKPISNVVATLRGSETPERTILFGTHHDAWTFGGVDPGTGAVALLETARVLGALAKEGWRPRRSIAFAFWDAEEFGLVGSTEYAEQLKEELRERLVAYINTDLYMAGRLDAGGVPSLRDFVADVARDIPEGEGDGAGGARTNVLDGWRASAWSRLPLAQRTGDSASFEPQLKALGSGADFVPFQDHLGVPTLSIEFVGANGYGFGTYHSNYDSRAYVERVADPGFAQGVTLVRMLGTLGLRMADAEVLPFRFSDYGRTLGIATESASGWARGADGREVVPVDLSGVRERVRIVSERASALEAAVDSALALGGLDAAVARALNDRLARMEQVLADDAGDESNAWYRHVIYGWNIYSLYDGQPFPGLAEAIRVRDAGRVAKEVGRIERALDRLAGELEAARVGLAAR